ncbi:beta-ketoacyl synthase N-terminal-like domain-containing protein [Saccharopolyspora elongata]|uniref:3-oxoacyl-ACP synthase n=1 Tax=Saccharopolyspora elongata TaxID=2530387 RepID=A0A4R4YHA9_9PSEU|nr:beta-ketoacyl synthase N-terminal-like domain-containing protein [Saccharopolyspora elongata]TDD44126.1 3-oxoacyl-ACP synthase [Saccharopolyspora elongata]
MAPTTAVGNPVISAWSTISPFGLSSAEFAEGVRSGRKAAVRLDRDEWRVPFEEAHLVPGFDIRSVLGRRGTRSMDRASGLAVAAVGRLLDGAGGERLPGVGEDTGLALGTSTGSAQSMMDFTRDSLVGERPYLVDPARFPNTVMNCAAGQSAIWHRLKGPNTTIAGGRATGLLALQYALRLQKAGRAETLLCGAVEEFSTARAWLEWHATDRRDNVLGEGAAVWLLERAGTARDNGRPGIAEVIGLEFGFAKDGREIRPVLGAGLRRLLDRSGVAPEEIWAVADSQAPGVDGEEERAAIADVLGTATPRRVPCAESIGDTSAASAAFQVAAVLALAEDGGAGGARKVVITSAESNGVVGAALLELVDPARSGL